MIFVLEDVDAASNVVKRRDGKKTADVVEVENRTWVFFALLAVLFYFIAVLVDRMTMVRVAS